MGQLLTIGQLANASRVRMTTIRYYERCGLLIPDSRSKSNYRYYSDDAIAKLRFIKNAQHLGFTLDEIAELLRFQSSKSDCDSVKSQATRKLESIDKKINSLKKMRKALKKLHDTCRGKGSLIECPIIEALNHTDFEEHLDEG